MEKYQTIDEYVATEMGDKITRKAKSPFLGLLILAVGAALLVLLRMEVMPDALMATCLTLGIIGLGVGLVLTAMCLTKAMWHYVYLPTRSAMRRRKCYLSLTDYQHCLEAISENRTSALATLQAVTSTNSALDLLYSRDHAVALLQAGRYDTGHFEPETPVVRLVGTEVASIQLLCK